MNTYNKLTGIIKQKRTAVCLSLDTDTFAKGQQILETCAPYICMVKLHPELFSDWDTSTHPQIIAEWKRVYNILVMLDGKLVDVPEISYRFLKNPYYKAVEWSDMVTVMSVNYIGITDYLRKQSLYIATIPVTEMNTGSPLFALTEYQKFIKDSVLSYPGLVGIINQKTYSAYQTESTVKETFLKMTPGVVVYDSEITDNNILSRYGGVHDNTSPLRYRTINDAMVRDGNDIVIIGGSLIREQDNLAQKAYHAAQETMQYSKFAY